MVAAELLERKQLLLPGVNAASLVADKSLLEDDEDER